MGYISIVEEYDSTGIGYAWTKILFYPLDDQPYNDF